MVLGENNQIIGNYVHDFSVSQSGSTVNNSGGAEVSWSCLEQRNRIQQRSELPERQYDARRLRRRLLRDCQWQGCWPDDPQRQLPHNTARRAWLWEGCSGNFTATAGDVMTNHGIIGERDGLVQHRVDSMWLFLCRPSTRISRTWCRQQYDHPHPRARVLGFRWRHFQMALVYDSDTSTGTDDQGGQPVLPAGQWLPTRDRHRQEQHLHRQHILHAQRHVHGQHDDHSHNLFVPANASISFAYGGSPALTLDSTESKVDLSASHSPPTIDSPRRARCHRQGYDHEHEHERIHGGTPLNTAIFAGVFNQDVAKQSVHAVRAGHRRVGVLQRRWHPGLAGPRQRQTIVSRRQSKYRGAEHRGTAARAWASCELDRRDHEPHWRRGRQFDRWNRRRHVVAREL